MSVGKWAESLVNFLIEQYGQQLGDLSEMVELLIEKFLLKLLWIPPWIFILISCGLVLVFKRQVKLTLLVLGGSACILHLGLWKETMETVVLVSLATAISIILGVPLGIVAAKRKWFYTFLHPVLDLMQTIPTFVYLIPTLMIFGLGVVPGIVSTVIFALPAPIRLTYLGITSVPLSLIELAKSFGANSWQLLVKTELPHAKPMIMAGISQCIMLSLSMVVMAALVGADGLGKPVVQALNTVNIVKGFEAGLAIVIVAIVLDRLLKIDFDPLKKPLKTKK